MDAFAQAAAAAYAGHKATARKSGRRKEWPYIPVIDRNPNEGRCDAVHRLCIRGLAYATREEAVTSAERHLRGLVDALEAQLREPRHRALREQHGLPREI
jgi:hypothetical protein